MLSILIPVFKYDVSELVAELALQCENTSSPFEIICADDGSGCEPPKILESNFTWHVNHENQGRAATRNILASMAKFENLLFLDADVLPKSPSFITDYLSHVNNSVVCGGIDYKSEKPAEDYLLRWNYGHKKEARSAQFRNKNPYASFMTGNFMCKKSVFEKTTFNATLKTYGHEDTLFGKNLLETGLEIRHVDNPVYHFGLETNSEFLAKSKEGIESLVSLYNDKKLTRHYSKIIKLFENLEFFGVRKMLVYLLQKKSENYEKQLIEKGNHIWKLQILKLIWFSKQLE